MSSKRIGWMKSGVVLGLALLVTSATVAAQDAPAPPATPSQKAASMFRDAESLRLTGGREKDAAELFESLVRNYGTSNLVPEAWAKAAIIYMSVDPAKSAQLMQMLKARFPNSQHTLSVYWAATASANGRDSKVPRAERIKLTEEYLDRYWAQPNFMTAVQFLMDNLLAEGRTEDADALMSHVLAESTDEGVGGVINLIQRGAGGRKDHENVAKVWGEAADTMPNEMPAYPVLRLLQIRHLIAGEFYEPAMKLTDELIRDRAKSEYGAYSALEVKPRILSAQEKNEEAAKALQSAIGTYSIFVLARHQERLAELEATNGREGAAIEILQRLADEPVWPWRKLELLDKIHDLHIKIGNVENANAVNDQLVKLFPESRTALLRDLRSVNNLLRAERNDDAATLLLRAMQTYKGYPSAAEAAMPYLARMGDRANETRQAFIAAWPASPRADEATKAMGQEPAADSPAQQAKAVHEEYKSFAKENNVDAARRRIDRLLAEFPSSPLGGAAALELADALQKAGRPEMAGELWLVFAEKLPYHQQAEDRLQKAGAAFSGVAKPAEAIVAYRRLYDRFRDSRSWEGYVTSTAGSLAAMDKLADARKLISDAANSVGGGVVGTHILAWYPRRLEGQEQWTEAADEMLKLLGANAANPAYRSLTGELFRWLVVSNKKDKEVELLTNLATRYEGWDEGDRIRISLAGTYGRMGQAANGVKLLEEIMKRNKYEIGASGPGMLQHLSKWSRGLFTGTVGAQPMDRVISDMSGGHDNYLHAHTAENMIDYVLLLNEPAAYIERAKGRLQNLVKQARKRPPNYRSGIPYKTPNITKPTAHPLPEQRGIYGIVWQIQEGHRRLGDRSNQFDQALWFDVYQLWPNYYMNDERLCNAARSIYGRDNARFAQALRLLQQNYTVGTNKLLWEPYILDAQARHERYNGAKSKAKDMYGAIVKNYPHHALADGALKAYQELGGR